MALTTIALILAPVMALVLAAAAARMTWHLGYEAARADARARHALALLENARAGRAPATMRRRS